jgi:methionyl-tRNA synthetase
LREVAFGQDGTFSHEAIVNRTNADLANDLGNLAQRSLSMIAKNCNAEIPACGALAETDRAVLKLADELLAALQPLMQHYELHNVVAKIWTVVAETNRYFADSAPWALKKTDPLRMQTVLYVTAEILRMVAILVQPIVPMAAGKLLDQLAVSQNERTFAYLGEKGRLKSGTPLPSPSGIFPRYVEAAESAEKAS